MTERMSVQRRLLTVVFAVAFAVGCVMVMRIVAQYIAGATMPKPSSQFSQVIETGANAPRDYALSDMIPPDFRYSIVGRPCKREETSYLMPIAVLLNEKDAESRARGWEPLSPERTPTAKIFKARRGLYYKTKEGRFVARQFWSENSQCSHMVEIELPDIESFSVDIRQNGPTPDLAEFAGVGLGRFRAQMPVLLRDTIVGTPVFTVLQSREENGGVFYVTSLDTLPVEVVEKRAVAAAGRAGWTRLELPPGMASRHVYQLRNLSLAFDCQTDVQHPGQTVISYRISDDEVRVKPKRSENENG